MTDISQIILRNLQYNEDYMRKTVPFLREEYFENQEEKSYYKALEKYFLTYNKVPTKEAIEIDFQNMKIPQDSFNTLIEFSNAFEKDKTTPVDEKWLLKTTETFCQDRALYLALMEAIAIADGDNKQLSKTSIPDIMSKALSVSFDNNIGHNYIEDTDARFTHYQRKENKKPMFLKMFNVITHGGIPKKTLNGVVAESGGGKSIFLTNLAANAIITGESVLYISMEMSEYEISKRIDANLLDVPINDVEKIPKGKWDQKINDLKKRVKNSLVVKEYPTGSASAAHFKYLLQELKQKKNFVPTIIIVDYLNICASARFKTKNNMYEYIKSISEELRALAVEQDVILWTAMQFNKEGMGNSEPEMTNIAESRGINDTMDFLFALIHMEDLAAINQVMIKVLKSRYGDKDKDKKFTVGLDKNKMRFYDLNNASTNSIMKAPIMQSPNQSTKEFTV